MDRSMDTDLSAAEAVIEFAVKQVGSHSGGVPRSVVRTADALSVPLDSELVDLGSMSRPPTYPLFLVASIRASIALPSGLFRMEFFYR
jgi:hypothetical protein